MQRHTPNLLVPKRSILAGLFKFLAVGCGLNEVSLSANIELSMLAESMAVYLTPQAAPGISPEGDTSQFNIYRIEQKHAQPLELPNHPCAALRA
jgi:hypothetical protein